MPDFETLWANFSFERDFFPMLEFVFEKVVAVLVVLLAASIIARIIRRIISAGMRRIGAQMTARGALQAGERKKRTDTLTNVAARSLSLVVWAIAGVMILGQIGFNIGPLLASAGVVGVAIGFGAQNLVRDLLAGFFMLLENQIRVGDVAIINGTGGLVEELNLRTTVLRDLEGTVHIFPNGVITTLSNKTRDYSYYIFDVGVAYKEDADQVMAVMREVGQSLLDDPEFSPLILEPLEIFGIDKFADSAVVIKARMKTLPIKQWTVGREFNRRLKKRFDEDRIEIPFPHRTVYYGDKPEKHSEPDEIRRVVREEIERARTPQAAGNSGR